MNASSVRVLKAPCKHGFFDPHPVSNSEVTADWCSGGKLIRQQKLAFPIDSWQDLEVDDE